MVEVMVSNTKLHNWEIDQQLALDSDQILLIFWKTNLRFRNTI